MDRRILTFLVIIAAVHVACAMYQRPPKEDSQKRGDENSVEEILESWEVPWDKEEIVASTLQSYLRNNERLRNQDNAPAEVAGLHKLGKN